MSLVLRGVAVVQRIADTAVGSTLQVHYPGLDTLQFFEDNIHIVISSVKELSKSHKRVVKSEVVTTDGDD